MPLYEYQCAQCAERVEVLQKISDPPEAQCPKCGGAMKRLLSAPAIQFKGSGFYKTDYASSSSSSSSSASSSSSSSAAPAASTTSESKSSDSKPSSTE